VSAAGPVSEVATASADRSQAPSEAAPATDQGAQAPPANPMFNAANFLKVLGLK
jgi:hypothetical protein